MGPIERVKGLAGYTENKGFPYPPRMGVDSKHRNVGFLALSGR